MFGHVVPDFRRNVLLPSSGYDSYRTYYIYYESALKYMYFIALQEFLYNIFREKDGYYKWMVCGIWVPEGELVSEKFNERAREDPHIKAWSDNLIEHRTALPLQLFRSVQSQYGTQRCRACLCTKPAITTRGHIRISHRYPHYFICRDF